MKTRAISLPSSRIAVGLVTLALLLSLAFAVFASNAQAKTVGLDGVRTTLTTDPGTTTTLFGAGIIPLPIAPTAVTPTADAAQYSFPITGGAVDSKTLAGKIRHSGGLLLAYRNMDDSWKALSLARFTINIDASPDLTAVVNGGGRASIADLDLSGIKITKYMKNHRQFIKIANVGVTLNKTATDAIDATFGTSLPDTVKLGTAQVLARVAR
jgi:hypothetical protein